MDFIAHNGNLVLEQCTLDDLQKGGESDTGNKGIIIPKSSLGNKENIVIGKVIQTDFTIGNSYNNKGSIVVVPKESIYYITVNNREYMIVHSSRVMVELCLD